MLSLNSYMPVRIISGKNCLKENASSFASFGKKCMILTGRNSAKSSGALDDVCDALRRFDIEYFIFDKIEPNPLTTTCHSAGQLARGFDADFVIGIGGGSVLDAAKAVAIYHSNPQLSHIDIYSRKIPSEHIPVVLVGTTSGTGSEVTGVSVLTNADNGYKKSISGEDCYASLSFCDYSYTKSTNTFTRMSTCFDAFAHAIESFFASTSNDLSERYSLKAVSMLSEYILKGNFSELNEADFEKLYVASVYAGLAINITGTCFPHTVGYFFTESYNIPHGQACALLLPALLERAKKYCPERLGTILDIFNCSFCDLISAIKNRAKTDICLNQEEIETIAERWNCPIKNFDRTPGGYSYLDAVDALKELIY